MTRRRACRACVAGHGQLRATIGRPAHQRFTDEQVGELLAAAQPRDDIEVNAVRVAPPRLREGRRVRGELIAEIARTGAAAPVARHEARQR